MKKGEINNRAIEAIYRIIDLQNISQNAFSEAIGCKPSKLTEILKGRMSVQIDMIASLCKDYGVSSEWILTGKGEMMKREDPVVQNVSGTHFAATANGDAVIGDHVSDKERITFLERLIEEKERTIQILMKQSVINM